MKKEITIKQYNELKKLGYKGGKTIGDLIEFLSERKKKLPHGVLKSMFEYNSEERGYFWRIWLTSAIYEKSNLKAKNLCDCLWKGVKQILEK